jgi:hypothetical protein
MKIPTAYNSVMPMTPRAERRRLNWRNTKNKPRFGVTQRLTSGAKIFLKKYGRRKLSG